MLSPLLGIFLVVFSTDNQGITRMYDSKIAVLLQLHAQKEGIKNKNYSEIFSGAYFTNFLLFIQLGIDIKLLKALGS